MRRQADNVLVMLNDDWRIVDSTGQWIIQRAQHRKKDGKVTGWRDWKFCATLLGLRLFASKPDVGAIPGRLEILDRLPSAHPR